MFVSIVPALTHNKQRLDEPNKSLNAEQRELLSQMAGSWKNDLAKDGEETLTTIQETSHERIQGSCLCQATAYAFSRPSRDLPEDFNWEANYIVPGGKDGSNKWAGSHCYCDSCRVSAGALVATWFSIPRAQLELEKKGPTTVYKSSSHATREFVSLPSTRSECL